MGVERTDRFKTCVAAAVPTWAWKVIELYRHYLRGHLPVQGGLLDQPAWLLQAFDVLTANWGSDGGQD